MVLEHKDFYKQVSWCNQAASN